jgi:hypothetical protein
VTGFYNGRRQRRFLETRLFISHRNDTPHTAKEEKKNRFSQMNTERKSKKRPIA